MFKFFVIGEIKIIKVIKVRSYLMCLLQGLLQWHEKIIHWAIWLLGTKNEKIFCIYIMNMWHEKIIQWAIWLLGTENEKIFV